MMSLLMIFILAILVIGVAAAIIIAVVAANNSKSKQIRPQGMYCSECGALLSVDNKYCDKCGKEM